MNILIVGRGKGSWTMRGEQLGAALGARVTSAPTEPDWAWAERIILVKRDAVTWADRARATGVPVIWDALDFWRQPLDNALPEPAARAIFQRMIDRIRPTLTIGATEAQASAAAGVALVHHCRLDLVPTPARRELRTIAYDGNAVYLSEWAGALSSLCARQGWRFVINPPRLGDVDLLVALRGGIWDGWMCRSWKSGVKLVNAICAGRPIITQRTAAWCELQPAGTTVDRLDQLAGAVELWRDYQARQAVADEARRRAPRFTVEALAATYRELLGWVA